MPVLTEQEHAELVHVLRDTIDGDRYFMSPRVRRLKSVLAKLDPASAKAGAGPIFHRTNPSLSNCQRVTTIERGIESEMTIEIVKEPYLKQLRTEVTALKRVVDGEPDQISVARAWASLGKIQEALSELCPNHPHILQHRW